MQNLRLVRANEILKRLRPSYASFNVINKFHFTYNVSLLRKFWKSRGFWPHSIVWIPLENLDRTWIFSSVNKISSSLRICVLFYWCSVSGVMTILGPNRDVTVGGPPIIWGSWLIPVEWRKCLMIGEYKHWLLSTWWDDQLFGKLQISCLISFVWNFTESPG